MTVVDLASLGTPVTPVIAHASDDEFERFNEGGSTEGSRNRMRNLRRFQERYPTLNDWLAEPLPERLGRLRGEGREPSAMTNAVNYRARTYILFMALTGRLPLPWDYLLMLDLRNFNDLAARSGHDWYAGHSMSLIDEASSRDWSRSAATQGITFCLPRFALRHADVSVVRRLTADDFHRLRGEIKDVYATVDPRCNTRWQEEDRRMGRGALSAAYAAHAIHFQLGLVADGPKQTRPSTQLISPTVPPAVQEAVEAWQRWDADRGTPQATLRNHSLHIRYFAAFIAEHVPDLQRLTDLQRVHITDYLHWLANRPQVKNPNQLLSDTTRRAALSSLASMLRDLHEHELAPSPGHALVHSGDYPKPAKRLPRFIPDRELRLVVAEMLRLDDPYQRCALLVARWSGARRDEIARLELDCIDTYADGTYRLRIPAGKTRKERMIPLADEAANAIEAVQALRALDRDAGTLDRVTHRRVRYLFMSRGRHLSRSFLFDKPLLQVCERAGLLTTTGGRTVTAHRFRHTLGTNLVEAGARWRTIMAILGHESADMTMTYAHVSDPEVKADYEKVVSAGIAIAGPAAAAIRNNDLSQGEVDWLQNNFYKSEMELGACIRLPEEGPCECDLFLTCGKFFTTKAHAPRLRRRWAREQDLIADAIEHEWPREVERHRRIQTRLEGLLADLGEPLDDAEST